MNEMLAASKRIDREADLQCDSQTIARHDKVKDKDNMDNMDLVKTIDIIKWIWKTNKTEEIGERCKGL